MNENKNLTDKNGRKKNVSVDFVTVHLFSIVSFQKYLDGNDKQSRGNYSLHKLT